MSKYVKEGSDMTDIHTLNVVHLTTLWRIFRTGRQGGSIYGDDGTV